ncbi:hypothetical protein [Paenibacillus sp. FSL H7-0714]|uniref:hypothetical protein n=1 Tax=Paenibacillus sp. FSL H7-0714 TaxID=2954735 RepID=UPI0030F53CAB
MKKIILLLGLGLLLLPGIAGADSTSIDLNNYYFAHANMPGEYVLKDKYNNTVLKGDYSQNDGHVIQISFRNWHASGSNKVVINLPDGSQKTVTNGETVTFPSNPKQVSLTLVKTDYTESYVEVSTTNVYDQSNGGVNLTYTFTGSPPSSFGSLGPGTPTSSPTPKPTATPNPTTTPIVTPKPTYVAGNLMAYRTGRTLIEWANEPPNTSKYEVYRDGVLAATLPAGTYQYNFPDPSDIDADYDIKAISSSGNVLAKTTLIIRVGPGTEDPEPTPNPTDPGDGGENGGTNPQPSCNDVCQNIKDQLKCPGWDDYMGAWSDMIKGSLPPPPDWENVAAIMRDTIVPSMGQEIVNRSPEIARIIADELQSREKAVSPPPTIADFKPNVPRITDTPKVNANLTDNVPNFTPDYTEDKGFVIPDPASIQFNDNTDKGYEYQPIESATPTFAAAIEPSSTDKGYKDADPVEIKPPAYVGGRYTPEETPPPYKPEATEVPMPQYTGSENTGDYRNYSSPSETFKAYGGG